LLPIAQKLISLKVHDESNVLIREALTKIENNKILKKNENNINTDTMIDQPFDESTIRLNTLEKYLRPALVPTE
jgi:hypothetical protein